MQVSHLHSLRGCFPLLKNILTGMMRRLQIKSVGDEKQEELFFIDDLIDLICWFQICGGDI